MLSKSWQSALIRCWAGYVTIKRSCPERRT